MVHLSVEERNRNVKDQYGRKIDYLRISITDRCNLRCTYCMPAEGVRGISHDEILRFEEIEHICLHMAKLGIKHLKITGGEPLVRRGCTSFIRQLKKIAGIETVTLTTNGILLKDMAKDLAQAGIDGINISLDTLDPEQYARITRGGDLQKVLQGIQEMKKYPQITTKINCVLAGEDWQNTAICLAGLAKEEKIHVRFIEHMPIGLEREKEAKLQDQVKELLGKVYGPVEHCEKPMGFGPSVYFRPDGFQGSLGFISAISHKFCDQCNRIRLTADGKLRLCLQWGDTVDLKEVIRGKNAEQLGEVIAHAIWKKPREHQFDRRNVETKGMSQIGG